MKNIIVCKNCSTENPFYGLICNNCKSYLRERIYNIDLWKSIALLIESPSKAFKLIIFSEHKNYIVLLLILIAAKLFLNGIFLTIYFDEWNVYLPGYFISFLIILVLISALLFFFSWFFGFATGKFGVVTKFNDNLAIIIYSLLPYAFGFLILFPLELVIFGSTLFYFSPSPFLLKPTIAYTLLTVEGLLILWSMFLTFVAFKVQSGNVFYSIVFSIVLHITIYFLLYLISYSIYL